MGYPGDQGKPGGRPSVPPPHEPYGPGGDRPEASPYGSDHDESLFAPRAEAGPGPSGTDPFGVPDPFGAPEPFGGFGEPSATQSFGPPGQSFEPPGRPGQPGQPGQSFGPPDDPSGPNPFGAPAAPAAPSGAKPFGPGDETVAGSPFGAPDPPPGANPFGAPDDPSGPNPFAPADQPVAGQSFGMPGELPPGGREEITAPARRRNLPLIIGGAVAAGLVLIGGGVGVSSMMKDDPKPKKAAAPSPTASKPQAQPSPEVPALEPVKLRSRATDPKALTLTEVFGKSSFKAGKQKYLRTAVNSKKGCTGVVGGATLTKTLKRGGCAQALRATYALGTGKLIGTVGVLNLRTEAAAKQAVKAAGNKDAFLQALPGKGISSTNGKGEALGTSEVFGHYVIMTWVQRPDGKKIDAKYHSVVRAFGAQLVKGSGLSLALHYRETEGKPLQK
ncbi:hypothetical protein [Actinomadura litoris]|uniref:Uncharacterized protein n=1 Tax=Actinomadura litoris TaxID=2678616 RepID=A0A7K1L821_9ACTN|nr:hypothetical protein [Actinomadura litoris]MUN40591.1 hypothetical protein [Actinomadura litoris]